MKTYKIELLVDQMWYQEIVKQSQYVEDGETFQWLSVEEQD